MKNMKLNLLLAGLLFSTHTQLIKADTMSDLDQAIHSYLIANAANLKALKVDKLAELKKTFADFYNKASEAEKETYKNFIDHLNNLDTTQLMKALGSLKQVVAALKEVNAAAHKVIVDNLPMFISKMVA